MHIPCTPVIARAHVRRNVALFLLTAVLATPAGSALAGDGTVPVRVGGSNQVNACGTTGTIVGLDPKGENFLAVRAAPHITARETDRLAGGREVFVCGLQGAWMAVVYGKAKCGVNKPIAERGPYKGPCKSGWVSKRFVEVIAG